MNTVTEAPAGGKTAEEILKSKAKIERARLKRVAARGAAKPKAKKKPTFRQATKKLAKAHPTGAKKVKRPKAKSASCVRSERLDMRLTKAEKAKVHGRAKALRRTVTSIVTEAIEKIK